MPRKKKQEPKIVYYKETLRADSGAKSLIAEIDDFLKKYNLDDASIEIATYPDYYDTVRTELEISYYGPEPRKVL